MWNKIALFVIMAILGAWIISMALWFVVPYIILLATVSVIVWKWKKK